MVGVPLLPFVDIFPKIALHLYQRAMEFAALLSFVLIDYVDGILITALLLLNACIGDCLVYPNNFA